VTGEPAELGKLVSSLDGFYRVVPSAKGNGHEVQHSAKISIVDPDGRLVGNFSPLTSPREAANLLAGLMRSHAKAGG
jgi:cytochrome oxidase Cu insertion factor (SCO1/SenC/PrrC family)